MVEGTNNLTSETSAYIFNALGKRIGTEQKIININEKYQNNINSGGNDYSEYINNLALADTNETGQKTFKDNFSLTRQTTPFINIKREYVTDYTSQINNDIMVYEKGSYVTKYVYGIGGNKLFQEVTHESGLTDVEKGSNPNTDIAVNEIKKVYFHQNRLGSTSFVSDKEGNVVYHAEYDDWGNITSDRNLDMNFAGLDDIMDYTGHNYDKVLDKFFAQARMYDPQTKRFISKDTAKDGLNWYSYCSNDPVNNLDHTGNASDRSLFS